MREKTLLVAKKVLVTKNADKDLHEEVINQSSSKIRLSRVGLRIEKGRSQHEAGVKPL